MSFEDTYRSLRVKQTLQVDGTITGGGASNTPHDVWYVDGNVSASHGGGTWGGAFKTIAEAITASAAGDIIYIAPITHTDYTGDPVSYAETLIIPYAKSNLSLIGISGGNRTQGGLPQIKKGSGTTALLTIRAPGCTIANLGFNGIDSTGGGILLDDDYITKSAFGTSIFNCHFKNCKKHATQATAGGAINWGVLGNAWQVLISGCRFYKNVCDIALLGTSTTRPQDVVIEDCDFSGYAEFTDCNIYTTSSGFGSVKIDKCRFGQVPALTSGNVALYMDLQGTLSGTITNCTFGCQVNPTGGTTLTFKDGGTAASFPVEVHIMRCYGQTINNAESAEISIE